MSKFKKGLVKDIQKEKEFEKEQRDLKEKYSLDVAEEVVVVEKSNAYKFTVKMIVNAIKALATICLLALATVGIITLIYPNSRNAFFDIMDNIYRELSVYLPFIK